MLNKLPKKMKSLTPKPLTIRLHGGVPTSAHTTNLRNHGHPLDNVEPYTPPHETRIEISEAAPSNLQTQTHKKQFRTQTAMRHLKRIPVLMRVGAQTTKNLGLSLALMARHPVQRLPSKEVQKRSTRPATPTPLPRPETPQLPAERHKQKWPYALTKKIREYVNNCNELMARTLRVNPLHSKALTAFVIIALVLILPIPIFSFYQNIQAQGEAIISDGHATAAGLKSGSARLAQGDFDGASREFSKTLETVEHTQAQLENIKTLLPLLPKSSTAGLAKELPGLTDGLKSLSFALLNFSEALKNIPQEKTAPTELIKHVNEALAVTLPRVHSAAAAFEQLDPGALPKTYQETLTQAQRFILALDADLTKFTRVNEFMANILGADQSRRYLIIFQNDAEIRPTGGFIGSLALLDVDRGAIKKLEIPGGGPYDFQGQQEKYVRPPQPLLLLNDRWELQDANWFPDFPTSAKQIMWFWEHAGQPSVDGVIAVNASLVERLLANLPAVELPKYNTQVTAANFRDVTQTQAEVLYDKTENKPKQFIADLAPEILKKMAEQKNPDDVLTLALTFSEGLMEGEIQLYFTDTEFQTFAKTLGVDGAVATTEPTTDYLYVVNTNIGGGKTDRVVTQTVYHEARVEEDGSIIDTVTIKRTHNGAADEVFYGADNINYLRVYVPRGAELLDAAGFSVPDERMFSGSETWYELSPLIDSVDQKGTYDEKSGTFISNEFSKTVFAHWLHTKPGETSIARMTYRLPFKAFEPKPTPSFVSRAVRIVTQAPENVLGYTLYVQKQPGVRQQDMVSTVVLPEAWQTTWQSAPFLQDNNRMTTYLAADRDSTYALAALKP
ncbi:MAG TPA: hypothetical protein DDW36_00700 [Candidatus Magasanikbacteria bacterium]|nr:hypothetical protein [Candidatus Magasanikbacteria bacterium]